jgi:mannose-6-phosphate isomerase-like protein (cupin superfamily)
MRNRYFVRHEDVPAYYPANHIGTVNKHLIDLKLTGAKNIEVVCGTLKPGYGALPHAHPGIEQVCYVREGAAIAGIDGQRRQLGPGDCCYFPTDMQHVSPVVGATLCKVLGIYSPPYGEDSGGVIR